MDTGALSASGVTRLHGHPYLKLKGSGTLVAIIDSGIDYLHPAFHRGMTSKILSIWDQELESGLTERIPFGREFNRGRLSRLFRQKIRGKWFHQWIKAGTERK